MFKSHNQKPISYHFSRSQEVTVIQQQKQPKFQLGLYSSLSPSNNQTAYNSHVES